MTGIVLNEEDLYGIVVTLRMEVLATEVNALTKKYPKITLIGAPFPTGGFLCQAYIASHKKVKEKTGG
jgi:hypothetical protein